MATLESTRPAALDSGRSGDVLALFDSLPSVSAAEMIGRWRGSEVPTGHQLDGLLGASGWYGKEFLDDESVHPLLFELPNGDIFPLEPRVVPFPLAGAVSPRLVATAARALPLVRATVRARAPRARLRELRHRGTVTAAMVYDHLPIIDAFRKLDADTVLGVMDLRGLDTPYFFLLQRS